MQRAVTPNDEMVIELQQIGRIVQFEHQGSERRPLGPDEIARRQALYFAGLILNEEAPSWPNWRGADTTNRRWLTRLKIVADQDAADPAIAELFADQVIEIVERVRI